MVNILVNKLDDETRKAFQVTQKLNSMSSWSEMFHFLQDRCHALGGIELSRASSSRGGSSRPLSVEKLSHNRSHVLHATETAPIECPRCRRKNHVLLNCYKFRKIGAENQLEMAVKYGICTKCLRESHSPKDCEDEPCDKCQDNHHTSLHSAFSKKSDELSPADQTFSLHTSVSFGINKKVMLSTVLLHILDANGHPHVCRALLDSGSESSMISEELAQTLKLRKIPTTTSIVGINGAQPFAVESTLRSSRWPPHMLKHLNSWSKLFRQIIQHHLSTQNPGKYQPTSSWPTPVSTALDPLIYCWEQKCFLSF